MELMPVKVRARRLIEKYLDLKYEMDDAEIGFDVAKHCALFTVEQILDAQSGVYGDEIVRRYWLAVEREIDDICPNCY